MACLNGNGMKTGEQQQGSKFGRWLKGKLNAITHKDKLSQDSGSLRQHGENRPLTDGASSKHARNKKTKQQQAVTISQHSANDDCSQVSSDQLSLVLSQQHSSRFEDHVQSKHPHRPAVDGSPRATANAATQLSALRELLVTHIRQATPTGNPATSHSGMPPLRSPRAAAGLTAKQAMAADHMQLLDLVDVLITDHRTSLLERKRLQQQLDLAQHALQGEWLDKERAAALADVRSEDAQQAQEHLASTAALAQQLHNRRVISSTRIKLPPAAGQHSSRRHSTGEEQVVHYEDSSSELCSEPSQQQQHRRQSEPCSSRPVRQQARAAGAGLSAERSRSSGIGGQPGRSATPSGKAAAGKATGSTPLRAARASAFSLRSGAKAAAATGATPAAGAGACTGTGSASKGSAATAAGKERRLLGRAAGATSTGLQGLAQQEHQQDKRAGAHRKQPQAEQEQAPKSSSWRGAQLPEPAQTPAVPAGPDEHAQALEGRLGGEDSTGLDAAPRQSSIDTQASSLAMSADADTMLGLTKGQLHKVLQRPWLQEMQEPADTASAAMDSSRQHGHSTQAAHHAAHRAATSAGQSQQESSAGSLAAENSPSDAQSLNAVIQSTSSGNGSVYASHLHPQMAALAADSDSSASACAAAGDTGSSAVQAQHKGRPNTAAHSSNGSWPGMKVSAAGISQAGAVILPPAARPSPLKQRSNANRLRGRSRAQPQQLSTSLESAATLPLQVTGGAGNERASHSSSVAEGAGQDGAPGWGCNSLEMVQEEQQHWQQQHHQQQQQPVSSAGPSTSTLGPDYSGTSQAPGHVLCRDDGSGHDIAAEHSGSQQLAGKQRRRWAAPSPVSQPEQLGPPGAHAQAHQQHAEQQAHKQQSHQHDVQQQAQPHKQAPAPAAGAVGGPQMLSKKHLQALAASTSMHSSGELSGGTSDLACMSITSAATGCTTLSGLAGVYLQHPSKPTKVCPRPSFVPKLELQGIAADPAAAAGVQQVPQQLQLQQHQPVQQQPQQVLQAKSKQVTPRGTQQPGQQLAGSSTPAASGAVGSQQEQRGQQLTPCSSTGHHLGSARSYLTAEELADIAPLMAHASSRRQSSTAGAPAAVSPAAGAAAAAPAYAASRPPSDCAGRVCSSGGAGFAAAGVPALGGVCPVPRCTPRASRSSTGSISSGGSGQVTSGGTAAGVQQEHSSGGHTAAAAAAAVPAGAGASIGPSAHRPPRADNLPAGAEASSNTVHRTSGGGGLSTRAYRPSSGGGSTGLPVPGGVGYWGSNMGSYPASENPSRQPTPRVSDAAAGAAGGGAERRVSRSRPSTAGNAAPVATSTGGAASSGSAAAAGQHSSTMAAPAAAGAGAGAGAGHAGHGAGVVLTAIPQPCAASATAAAATSFMTMRPAHLYRSVSTVYAMYSPLMGNLRALGHSRAASHLSTTVTSSHAHHHHHAAAATAGADPAAAAHGRQPPATSHTSSQLRPEVPTFAGLASMTTTTVVEPHAGADMAAAVAAAAAAAHEYHWQALLGGCPHVPEDTSVQGQEGQQQPAPAATAATDGVQPAAGGAFVAAEGQTQSSTMVANADGAAVANSARVSTRGQHSQGQAATAATRHETDRHEAISAAVTAAAAAAPAAANTAGLQQQPQQAAAVAAAAAAAAAQPQSSRLHQRTQPLQVQVPEVLERDVIERGPVLPPASLSGAPAALSPHRQRLGSPTRLMSPLAAAAAAVAREVGDTGASSPLLAAAEAGAPVGPLMMSSPTRLQWQRGHGRTHAHSSHNHGHGHSQHSRSAAATAPRQQHRQQQQQQQQQQPRHRSRPMSPGRAAAIEAAAASVAAHVAAAAQLIHRQEKRISNSQLLLQPEAPAGTQPVPLPQQQQQQQEPAQIVGVVAAPLRRQQSQGVQAQMDAEMLPQQQQQQQQSTRVQPQQQQQQTGTLELDCSLCCFSPTSAAGDAGGAWIQEASPNALVAAASATVDSLMQQAERLGMQCLSHRTTQQQQQGLPQGFSHGSFEARLHSHSSFDMGRLSSTSSVVLAQQQLQLQQSMPPPPARPARESKAQRTPGSHKKRRSRSRWNTQQQQQQQQQHNNPLYQLQLGEEATSLELVQQQQLPYFEHRTPPRSSRSRSSSRRSSSHHQHSSAVKPPSAYRTVRTPPMSPGAAAAAARDAPEELIVQTYQNPLLALEAAVQAAGLPGLGSSVDAELVSAALLPGLVEQLAQQASEASSYGGGGGFGLPGGACGCDAAAGVSAAAVPVHMTPLAKDRSLRRVGSQQGLGLSREGSGAGGQLHWNPLFRTGEDVPLEASYN